MTADLLTQSITDLIEDGRRHELASAAIAAAIRRQISHTVKSHTTKRKQPRLTARQVHDGVWVVR